MLKKTLIVLAFLAFLPAIVLASGGQETAVASTVEQFLQHLDSLEWEEAEALMCDTFFLDYSSFGGGPAAELTPSDVLGAWQGLLPGFDKTHHLLGALDMAVNGNHATVDSHVTATHYIAEAEGGDTWTVYGDYNFALEESGGVWRIRGLTFNFGFLTGNPNLPTIAGERAASL